MQVRSANTALARTTMLVVDDSAAMCAIMKTILTGLGVGDVLVARRSDEAWEVLRQRTLDLVFVDWRIPPMNGVEFVRQLRRDPDSPCPFIPVIMCTGYTEALHVVTARDAGVTEFLAKPVSADAVARRIEEVIHRPRNFVRADRFFGPDRRRLARGPQAQARRATDFDENTLVRFEDG